MRIANDNVRIVDVVNDLGCGRAKRQLGNMVFVGDAKAFVIKSTVGCEGVGEEDSESESRW